MNHLSLKSLTFYGVAIGSVGVLFSLTTAYGEANLKAPQNINGRYPISNQALPGCLNSNRLLLDVKQSGIYLTADVLKADASETVMRAVEQRPLLSGQWNNQQFSLTGPLTHLDGCHETVTIAGTVNGETMNGTIRLNSVPEAAFSAQREKPVPKAQGH